MTIGIAAFGPNAGLAVFQGLRAAERVGTGAIGGFATYAAIGADGVLHRHQTQRGGSRTLFIDGEATGLSPPEVVATATIAAVISSGPERPEPLVQFLAAEAEAGLVTGHRLPNGPSVSGMPLNIEALNHLRAGRSARQAVDAVIEANPHADVGLIAADRRGSVFSRNSERVARRPDLGHARMENTARTIAVEVLHNAIGPGPVIGQVAAAVAFETMSGKPQPAGWITIPAGITVTLADENAVLCGDDLVATKVTTTDPIMVEGRQVGAAVYLHSRVYRADQLLGLTMFEPIVTVEDGVIVELSGQRAVRMSYLAPKRGP